MSKEEIPTVNFLVESNSLNRVATKLKELGILESDDIPKWSKNPSNGEQYIVPENFGCSFRYFNNGKFKVQPGDKRYRNKVHIKNIESTIEKIKAHPEFFQPFQPPPREKRTTGAKKARLSETPTLASSILSPDTSLPTSKLSDSKSELSKSPSNLKLLSFASSMTTSIINAFSPSTKIPPQALVFSPSSSKKADSDKNNNPL